jgi:aminomethyltransferase
MVDFAGWHMPLHYGSQIEEHHRVRRDAAMFDVSHMGVIDIVGPDARDLLRYLFTNDVARLEADGDASYGCMLREDGGVLDDLVVFLVGDSSYRLVVNAGPRDHDLAWILGHAEAYDVEDLERRDLAMIALQGPNARDKAAAVLDVDQRERALGLRPFQSADCGGLYVARTGYTGEDGWEMLVPSSRAVEL